MSENTTYAYNTPDHNDYLSPLNQQPMSQTSKGKHNELHQKLQFLSNQPKKKEQKRAGSNSSISSMRESFISIKVWKSKHKDRKKDAKANEMKLREDPYKNRLFDSIRKKLEESQQEYYNQNLSVDSIPYDHILQKLSPQKHNYSRFESFLKFEMAEKEVVAQDENYKIEWKDKMRGKFHYSKPGEWIHEKGTVDKDKHCVNNYARNNDPIFIAETAGNDIHFYSHHSDYRKERSTTS